MAINLARKVGYSEVPWVPLSHYLIWAYTVLTLFVMFLRPDFLNLTICLVGSYILDNESVRSKGKFRVLVLAIFLSLIYDFIWFFIKTSEYYSDEKSNDGSNEAGLRKFSLVFSYASFILRVSYSVS
jgi:hypothetical protein